MGINQRLNRLTTEFSRIPTKSWLTRSYLFVSNDQSVKRIKSIEVFLNDEKLGTKNLDISGRIGIGIGIGTKCLAKIGNRTINSKIENGILTYHFRKNVLFHVLSTM